MKVNSFIVDFYPGLNSANCVMHLYIISIIHMNRSGPLLKFGGKCKTIIMAFVHTTKNVFIHSYHLF